MATTTQNWTALGEDILVYLGKSLMALLFSISSLALTVIAWVSSGLSITLGKLSDYCYKGTRLLNVRLSKIRWYKK